MIRDREDQCLRTAMSWSRDESETGYGQHLRRRTCRDYRHRCRALRRPSMVQHHRQQDGFQCGRQGKYTVVIEKERTQSLPHRHILVTAKARHSSCSATTSTKPSPHSCCQRRSATGQKTTIFFTFWGLNVIKKVSKTKSRERHFRPHVQHDVTVSFSVPAPLKMSMFGIGDKMMRHIA